MELVTRVFSRARIALLSAIALAVTLLVAVAPVASPAEAADMSKFRAGNIISDSLFFNGGALSAAQVQSFLSSKVPTCNANLAAGNPDCLKNYSQTTPSVAYSTACNNYYGGGVESAATIIYKVGVACGISQKVLIVMLQKEQGLITDTAPTAGDYRAAMGAGCPDTAACDTAYYGFFNQVWYAARLLKDYNNPTAWYFNKYKAGTTSYIQYNPNAGCGGQNVFVENAATHSLYVYTPYTPTQAALNAGYGYADACSAYGNRNFYNYYSDWFGSTQATGPAVSEYPSFTGTSFVGGLLTASPGIWAAYPTPGYAYQWLSCAASSSAGLSAPANCVARTTTTTYAPSASDVGRYLVLRVTASNSEGSVAAWSASTASAVVSLTSGVSVSGSYEKWLGATTAATVPTDGPVNSYGYPVKSIQAYLTLVGIPTDVDGVIGPQTRSNVAAFQTRVGLAADGVVGPTTWGALVNANAAASYRVQWQKCSAPVATPQTAQPSGCSNISGATGATYAVTAGDVGSYVTLAITATKGTTTQARWTQSTVAVTTPVTATPTPTPSPTSTSTPTPTPMTNPPTITGSALTNATLTAASGSWLGAATAPIPTDGPTYSVNAYPVKAIQTYLTRDGFPTTVDGNYYNATTVPNVKAFQTKYGLLVDGLVGPQTFGKMTALRLYTAYAYQWVRCSAAVPSATATAPTGCSDISGALSSTYVPTASDLGKFVTVRVTGVKGATTETRWAAVGAAIVVGPTTSPTPTPSPTATSAPSPTATATPTPSPTTTVTPSSSPTPVPTAISSPPPTTSPIGLANAPTAVGTAKVGQTLTGSSVEWLGATTAAIPSDGPKYGTNAYPVKSIQTYLTRAGFPTTVDGLYGNQTKANVKAFQTKYGLVADGLVGPVTWSKMLSLKLYTQYSYQWMSCTAAVATGSATAPTGCTDISGATAKTYVVKSADIGKFLLVKVNVTTGMGLKPSGPVTESRWSATLGATVA